MQDSNTQIDFSELSPLIDQLLNTVKSATELATSGLDEKLAEYVFFPLYHIFGQLNKYPMTIIEKCLDCLTILIVHGWKTKISSKLAQQIFSLLTFIIDGVPGSKPKARPEETILGAYKTQHALLDTVGNSPLAAAGLADQEFIPALGHGVTVILDGIMEGVNTDIQAEAIACIRSLFNTIRDREALASFLPGTISAFAKLLSAPTKQKSIVLAHAIEAVGIILTRVLGDVHMNATMKRETDSGSNQDKTRVLSKSWFEATASQVRMAIAPIMKLRSHDSLSVRTALNRFCIKLLDECHSSLNNCSSFLIETAIILDPGAEAEFSLETNLGSLVSIYPELENSVKSTVFNWMSSLPGSTQSADEAVPRTAIHNFLKGMELLRHLRIESSTIEDTLPYTLRDTLTALMSKEKSAQPANVMPIDLQDSHALVSSRGSSQYPPIVMSHESQRGLKKEMMDLISFVGSTSQQTSTISTILESARDDTSVTQVASFWLCYKMIRAVYAAKTESDEFLNLSAVQDNFDAELIFDELYNYSVQILDNHSDATQVDWRLEATALEMVTFAAQEAGKAYRPELMDVLFPVATLLGSESTLLQQHAIITLNELASACEYGSVSELIVDNIDYMVNSVSLRLNTLDISPTSTQVLTMMVRLAGPRVIPFLDDVVDSVFAALENYHGYPAFVESLFVVLKEIVDQASHTDRLQLEDRERASKSHKKTVTGTQSLQTLSDFFQRRSQRKERESREMETHQVIDSHPQRPWGDKKDSAPGEEDETPPEGGGNDDQKPPNSPTYQLLNRVANLTQFYLTSPTPKLRRSLLELLNTASKVLAADEDAFLPLVNSVWPVVIARLHDPESFIATEACHTLYGLCEAAGDFLSTRFKTEWSNGLGDWCRRNKAEAIRGQGRSTKAPQITGLTSQTGPISLPIRAVTKGVQAVSEQTEGSGSLGQYASPARIWEATVKLLTGIVSFVRIDDDMFDQILDLLLDVIGKNESVREALETVNKNAVWLAEYQRGLIAPVPAPKLDGFTFAPMRQMSA